jgi:hypothetical protein
MKLKPKVTIADYFSDLDDHRVERTKGHQLIDIITIAIRAVICGADGWVSIETGLLGLRCKLYNRPLAKVSGDL